MGSHEQSSSGENRECRGFHFQGPTFCGFWFTESVNAERGGDPESGSGATPAVLRTSMEKRNMKKFAMVLIDLTNTSMLAGVPAAALFYSTGAAALAHMTRAVTQVKTSAAQRCAVHDRSCDACESH